jgi:hypothetical protein
MTIFDILASILFKKQKTCINTIEDESAFTPYMVNRWISMYSPELALISNKINKFLGVFDNKNDLYNLFLNMTPRVKQKRIQYIKKNKTNKDQVEDDDTVFLSNNLELSRREVSQYIDFLKS